MSYSVDPPTQEELRQGLLGGSYFASMGFHAIGVDLARKNEDTLVTGRFDSLGFFHQEMPKHEPLTHEGILKAMSALRARRWDMYPRSLTGVWGPDEELNWRLNQRMQGKDPGPPDNWPGLEEAQRRTRRKSY